MAIKHLETYTVLFYDDDGETYRKVTAPNQRAALEMAAAHVGNWSYSKPSPTENMFLFGPGNGDTTVFIRQDLDMDFFMGRHEDPDYEIHDCGRVSHRAEAACIQCGASKPWAVEAAAPAA